MRPFADARPELTATLAAGVLVAAVAFAYANAFGAAWQFDDFATILKHPAMRSLAGWWHALPGIRPLLKLSYALTFELGGGVVAGCRAARATSRRDCASRDV